MGPALMLINSTLFRMGSVILITTVRSVDGGHLVFFIMKSFSLTYKWAASVCVYVRVCVCLCGKYAVLPV